MAQPNPEYYNIKQPGGWGRLTPAQEVTPDEKHRIKPQGGPLSRRIQQIRDQDLKEPLVTRLAEQGRLHARDFTENR